MARKEGFEKIEKIFKSLAIAEQFYEKRYL
jgi:rubrerythrin